MMKNIKNLNAHLLTLSLLLVFLCTVAVDGFASGNHKGWEKNSDYNSLYDPAERDSLKGVVGKFVEVTPLPGMAEGTAFILEEKGGDDILIHLCPQSYATSKDVGFKRGDEVKVKGAWIEIDGKDIFVAAKVKKGEHYEFKVRLTSDGTPFWTMTPEELAEESHAN